MLHQQILHKFIGSHNGKKLNPQAMLKANPMIAKVIIARLMSLNDSEKEQLKQFVSGPAAPLLQKILPEFAPVIQKVNNAG